MAKRIVLLTKSELRHEFFRKFIANDPEIEVLATYCESQKGNLNEVVKKDKETALRTRHLATRAVIEYDFFGAYCESVVDQSQPIFIEKGAINEADKVQQIIDLQPDLLVSYGCSIIRSELLSVFQGRFVNIHLGLSPYYRGSGTNFWPFVNNELSCVGTTFMYIDAGIDTGQIIHQVRANITYQDNIHLVGNRLIRDSFVACKTLIKQFDQVVPMAPLPFDHSQERYYRKKDFTEASLAKALENIHQGSIEQYLAQKEQLDAQYPLMLNPSVTSL